MSYPGAKAGAGVYQVIINEMPPHGAYVEPYLGSGEIMRRKKPAAVNIGIDIDPAVVTVAASLARSGGWRRRFDVCRPDVGDGASSSYFFHVRDGSDYLRRAAHLLTDLVYCDPPYLMSTRRQHRRMYRYELDRSGHVELLDVVRALRCMVMVSGYRSELYDRALAGWRRVDYQVQTHGGPAVESLWMNYPEPTELHDYRYLGSDYRDRERIRRQQRRWASRLLAMPDLERLAMLAALAVPAARTTSSARV